jgi:excisionase family DNA binding protein
MELLTVQEVARFLKVNPMTVRRYIASGRLPAVRVGRRVRVSREAAEALPLPLAPKGGPLREQRYTFQRPSDAEIARRQQLFDAIVASREQRRIAPLTAADLVRMAREEEERKHAGH